LPEELIDSILKNSKNFGNYSDEALLLIKSSTKSFDDVLKLIDDYGDDFINAYEKHGDDAVDACTKYGKDGGAYLDELAALLEKVTTEARAIGIVDEVQLAKIAKNTAEAVNNGSKLTKPTLPEGGTPRGTKEVPDINDIRPKELQNEAADLLANKGYDIEMLPEKIGGNGHGVTSGSNPDYLIDGEAFDCYSPKKDTPVRNIWSTVKAKTETQAKRIILNLDDYSGSLDDIAIQFYTYKQDLTTLEELIVIKNGKVCRLIVN